LIFLLSSVSVPPSAILVLDEEGNPIRNSTTLGPLREGHTLGGTCEVRGARPAPTVGWYRGGKKLSGNCVCVMRNDDWPTCVRVSSARGVPDDK
jgi:CD80-like C2-set immunoglobulin domain